MEERIHRITRQKDRESKHRRNNTYSLYVTKNSFEQRKLLNILLQNSVLEGGKVHSELKKPFDILADGIEEVYSDSIRLTPASVWSIS